MSMAAELGLEHSAFVNPHGLDADGHYTSANDLVTMAVAALEDPVLARMARTRKRPLPAASVLPRVVVGYGVVLTVAQPRDMVSSMASALKRIDEVVGGAVVSGE